LRGVTKIWNW